MSKQLIENVDISATKKLVATLRANQRDASQPPHLSASALALHMRCPRQYQASYIFGQKGQPNDAMMLGNAVHLGLSRLLVGEDMGDFIQDALEQADYAWEDPRTDDLAVAMVYHYWETVGKHIQPQVVATEREFLIEVPGVELPLLGYIDIETQTTLIDLKTTRYFSRKSVRPNKEWRFQQGIYQLEIPKPSEVHVLTRAKTDPVVVPDSTSHPLHFGRIDSEKIERMVRDEWRRICWHYETYGEKPWPGNYSHDWASKYCSLGSECACVL